VGILGPPGFGLQLRCYRELSATATTTNENRAHRGKRRKEKRDEIILLIGGEIVEL